MKLVIKELDRKTGRVVTKWVHEYSLEDCLKSIKNLDNEFMKEHFKFKYEIIGD